jgi:phage terminase small subunit
MAGRHRQPTSILEARGTFKHDKWRERPFEPDTGLGVGPPPMHLPLKVRKIWNETLENCAPGVFQSSDKGVLEAYCKSFHRFRTEEELDLNLIDRLLRFWMQFGMTPAARSQIIVKKMQAQREEEPIKQGLKKFVA